MSDINLEKEEENKEKPVNKVTPSKGVVININLLGYQAREELEKSSSGFKIGKSLIITIALLGLAVLLNVISYILMINFRDEQAIEKTKLTARKAELDSKNKELTQLLAERDIVKQKKAILLWATGNTMKWSVLLEEIRGRIPSNLWVDKIDISESLKLSITGQTFDHKTVATFLANLQDSAMFSDVTLGYTRKTSSVKLSDLNKEIQDEKDNKSIPLNEDDRFVKSETKFSITATVVVPLNQ